MSVTTKLELTEYLPYRLAILSAKTSGALAKIYARRFGITIPEWRVLANLGLQEGLSANAISGRSGLDKVQVSRAIARLLKAKLITRNIDKTDRRRAELFLTAEGRAIYEEIVPAAQAYQKRLLAGLESEERAQLDYLLSKLLNRAEYLDEAAE